MSSVLRMAGYVRVSTDLQDISPGVKVQALEREAARSGWKPAIDREDAASAATLPTIPHYSG